MPKEPKQPGDYEAIGRGGLEGAVRDHRVFITEGTVSFAMSHETAHALATWIGANVPAPRPPQPGEPFTPRGPIKVTEGRREDDDRT